MRQPIKLSVSGNNGLAKSGRPLGKTAHKYGISKLERDFAKNFLDRLGLVYIYQYEVREIGRFYDFAVTSYDDSDYIFENKDGIRCVRQDSRKFVVSLLIEVDGDYFHSNPKFFKDGDLSLTQRRNKRVDRLKDEWAGTHCVPLLRIWEDDIRNNQEKVMNEILQYVSVGKRKKLRIENKKIPH